MGTYGVFSESTGEGLTLNAVEQFKVPKVPEGSVLFSFKLTVGKVCITDQEVVTNEAIAHFKRRSSLTPSPSYTYLWLSLFDATSLDSTSSIATATNSQHIKSIRFLIPSIEVSTAFESFAVPIFDQIRNLTHENRVLTKLRDTLLPRLISGELEIPEELLVD
jgi:type I restriction enzyme S subunit